jgi:adenylate cyclase
MGELGKFVRITVVLALIAGWSAGTGWVLARASEVSFALWLEHWTGDFRTALLSHRPKRQHDSIALVTITDETMQRFPYRSPIDRQLLAQLITLLDNAGAKSIGLDFLFLKPTEVEKDKLLIDAIAKAKTRVVIAVADRRVELNPAQRDYQNNFLARSGARAGYANLLTGGDNIVRYIASPGEPAFPNSFAAALVSPDIAVPRTMDHRRIAWMLSPHDGNERFFSIPAHLLVGASGKPTAVAPALLARFKDKFVIVGAQFPDIDRHEVPMLPWRGEDDEVAGMLIHAQVAAQFVDGRDIRHLDQKSLIVLLSVLAFLGVWFGMRHGIVAVSLYASAASLLVVAADMTLFHFFALIIPFGACLGAMAAGVAGGMLLRVMRFAV